MKNARPLLVVALILLLGADTAPLSLGGVAVGSSVLDAIHSFGLPNAVASMDDGHWWQWNGPNGLDREVVTGDDLIVKRVLVATVVATSPGTTSPPPEPIDVPILGLSVSDAVKRVQDLGGAPLPVSPSTSRAWLFRSGVLVADLNGSNVSMIRALDDTSARILGYLQPALAAPRHHAPMLVKTFIPEMLPQGSGTVLVRVEVDATGTVSGARVIVTSHDRAVDDWELSAIKRATFLPAQCDGVPCPGVYIDVGGITRP